MTEEQRIVLLALDTGEQRARTTVHLATALGLTRREVEAAIQALRLDGYPICSGSLGYWMPADPDELARSNRSLHGRLRVQYATLRRQRQVEHAWRRRLESGVLFPEAAA